VPLGFDLAALAAIDDEARRTARAALGITMATAVVTTVGRLTAIKNHALLLEAACRLDPASAGAHADLAAGYYLAGRYAEAWKEVALARRLGAEPSQDLLRALSGKLPDPGGRR